MSISNLNASVEKYAGGMLAGLFGVCFAAWVLYKIAQAPRFTQNPALPGKLADKPSSDAPSAAIREDTGFTSMPLDHKNVLHKSS